MSITSSIDYGPLQRLIGIWKGDKGLDIAPEEEGAESNPYFETITFEAIGDVTNAGSQVLAVVHYRQVVQHKSNGVIFHDQTGYWMWDKASQTVIHSLTIPRAVSVLAGGLYHEESSSSKPIVLNVSAELNHEDWSIIQSPFMRDNASTTAFQYSVSISENMLSYSQTTHLDIYGRVFQHTDQNELMRQ